MLQKSKGIVLHSFRIKDNKLVTVVYTELWGYRQFVCAAPRAGTRTRARMPQSLLMMPLNLVEVEADPMASRSSLCKLSSLRCYMPLQGLAADPLKITLALFLQEFLYHALRGEDGANAPLYAYLEQALCWLDAATKGFANFHLVLMMRLCAFLGIQPNLEDYTPQSYFDLQNGCFSPSRSWTSAHVVEPAEAAHLVNLSRLTFATMHLFAMNRKGRTRLLELINAYYSLHLPNFPPLKGGDVLHEVLAG